MHMRVFHTSLLSCASPWVRSTRGNISEPGTPPYPYFNGALFLVNQETPDVGGVFQAIPRQLPGLWVERHIESECWFWVCKAQSRVQGRPRLHPPTKGTATCRERGRARAWDPLRAPTRSGAQDRCRSPPGQRVLVPRVLHAAVHTWPPESPSAADMPAHTHAQPCKSHMLRSLAASRTHVEPQLQCHTNSLARTG